MHEEVTDPMDLDENEELHAPEAGRVAARALVLAAVTYRGHIENEKSTYEGRAEDVRRRIVAWLDDLGLNTEMEAEEANLLMTPVGGLDRKAANQATWRSEGLVVLAWAMKRAPLPSVHDICQPGEIADAVGFLQDREATPLSAPSLREPSEVSYWANTYLALHWRLRQFSLEPGRIDFVSYASNCKWADMRIDELEVVDSELAIKGVPIDRVDDAVFHKSLSITMERRVALDWLLGFETLYSDVTTDT
jgi:hypothetical protein